MPAGDEGRRLYLDVDGAMSYANVWLNGQYVGGWPYGYASWQVDLTPYVKFGGENVIAIRLDNPPNSSRWYPGGGIYRNVWLVKTAPGARGPLGNLPDDAGGFVRGGHGQFEGDGGQQFQAERECQRVNADISPGFKRSQDRGCRGRHRAAEPANSSG